MCLGPVALAGGRGDPGPGAWREAGDRLDDRVAVGAGEPERADARDPPRTGGPRDGVAREVQREPRPRDVGVRYGNADLSRDLAVLDREDGLHQARHPGDRLEVAEVRLG